VFRLPEDSFFVLLLLFKHFALLESQHHKTDGEVEENKRVKEIMENHKEDFCMLVTFLGKN
jgi:hypothetical protein